jgi:hypothetical protein
MNAKTDELKDVAELIQAARIAQEEPGDLWKRIADHFADQREMVEPRPIDQTAPKGNY